MTRCLSMHFSQFRSTRTIEISLAFMSSIFFYVFAVILCRFAIVGNLFGKTAKAPKTQPVKVLQKIVGGTNASEGQFPYQVQLAIYTESGTLMCGGTLVSSSYVVSAAHCLYGHNIFSITVYAGGVDAYSSTAQISQMENVWIHPEYSANTKNNDLSIITLYTPFTLNSNVATMPLAASTATFNAGTSCTVSGWGDTVEGGSTSDTLLYASVSIVDKTTCENFWVSLPETAICTTSTNTDTCQGDSGGPVICSGTARDGTTTNVLAGIVSFGEGCARGIPAVNTRVSSYSDLIYNYTSVSPATDPLGLVGGVYVGGVITSSSSTTPSTAATITTKTLTRTTAATTIITSNTTVSGTYSTSTLYFNTTNAIHVYDDTTSDAFTLCPSTRIMVILLVASTRAQLSVSK